MGKLMVHSMAKRPSFQFYPADWLTKIELRMVSVAARGLWIDMICIMHQGEPYGYLKVKGKVISKDKLGVFLGVEAGVVESCLSELEGAGLFSTDDEGAIYSRRMVRDEVVRAKRAAGGCKGGNPALMNKVKDKTKDNLDGKHTLPPPSSSSSSSSSKEKKELDPILEKKCGMILAFLNSKARTKARIITPALRARVKDYGVDKCKRMIHIKCSEWMGTEFQKHLNTTTLFRPENFERYLNQPMPEGKTRTESVDEALKRQESESKRSKEE